MTSRRPSSAPKSELEIELEKILTDTDPQSWNAVLDKRFANLTPAELRSLLATIQGKEWQKAFFDHVTFAIHNRWLDIDPLAAICSANEGGLSADLQSRWLRFAVTIWAAQSPAEALAFIEKKELKSVDLQDCYGSIAAGAAKNGSVDLVNQVLAQITDSAERMLTLDRLVGDFAESKDAAFVNAWILTLPEHEQADATLASAVTFANTSPETTVAFLQKLATTDPELYAITTSRVLSKWAEKNPAGTAEWLTSQGFSDTQKPRLLANLLRVWQEQDRTAADAWLAESVRTGKLDLQTVREAQENL